MKFEFGVLPERISVKFGSWEIKPLNNYQNNIIENWQSRGDDRDWVYPPPETLKRGVWKLPSTHELIYNGRKSEKFKSKVEIIASFIIYLVGVIYGIQLQHTTAGWFVRGKQPKRTAGTFYPTLPVLTQILGIGTKWFVKQSRAIQIAMTSALFIHNLVPAFERDWERYSWQYVCFDAAWFVAHKSGLILGAAARPSYLTKFSIFAKTFKIRRDKKQFRRWAKYRNDLIHQITWGKVVPGHRPRTKVRRSQMPLRDFTTIGLLAIIGYKGKSLRARLGSLSVQALQP